MNKYFWLIIFLILFLGCTKENTLQVDVSDIDVETRITRFEQTFYTSKEEDLPKIKEQFREIFHHDVDNIWIKKMRDKDELELYAEVQKVYPDLDDIMHELDKLFKHIKYYYPNFYAPEIITVISNIPLEQKVILDGETLYISLDVFLGVDHPFYSDYPEYIKQDLTKEGLIIEVAKVYATQLLGNSMDRSFISRMIQRGKLRYLVNAFLPELNDYQVMQYTPEQLQWNKANEEMIWRYFVGKKLLYSTEQKLDRRFLEKAPFSKFYLDIDNESSGRVGAWLGLQIVKAYMENNEAGLKDLLRTKNETIFKKSNYRPKN